MDPRPPSAVIEVRRNFDPVRWQVAAPTSDSGATLLLTWTAQPQSLDAGVPLPVRTVLAQALCAVGACWFAGDAGGELPVATLTLRRKLERRQVPVFRADRPAELLPAFESGAHDWSMGAQWIVVGERDGGSDEPFVGLLKRLFEDWTLPQAWPREVAVIVQAGVDGDAAGCHCPTAAVEATLRETIRRFSHDKA